MQGDLQSAHDVRVDGQVNGNIRCMCLTIEPGGTVRGNIIADAIIVRGTIKGIIRANSVTLQSTAQVESEIFHKTLIIEQGAQFQGVSRRRCADQARAMADRTRHSPTRLTMWKLACSYDLLARYAEEHEDRDSGTALSADCKSGDRPL